MTIKSMTTSKKLTSYKDKYISKEEHGKQVAELERRLKEETLSEENVSKEEFGKKITALEQKGFYTGRQKSRSKSNARKICRIH